MQRPGLIPGVVVSAAKCGKGHKDLNRRGKLAENAEENNQASTPTAIEIYLGFWAV